MLNVIADIAGQYKTLQALLAKMPPGIPVSVGDMIDRGPQSREVVEFFKKEGFAVLGNHEHFMYEDYMKSRQVYSDNDWRWNGGEFTLESYGQEIPDEVISWIAHLPLHIEVSIDDKRYLISHTFLTRDQKQLSHEKNISNMTPQEVARYTWNRNRPVEVDGIDLQICGHNSQFGLREFVRDEPDNAPYAICLDASRSSILTGIHLPTGEIFQQAYLD